MRKLASFDSSVAAEALDRLLSRAEIPTVMRSAEGGERTIWIVSEQDMTKAQQLLELFERDAETQPPPNTPIQPQQPPRPVVARKSWRERAAEAPVTTGLLVVCTAVALYTRLGADREHVAQFAIADLSKAGDLYWNAYAELRAGQVWRVFTPILLHFHVFHLLFNAFWLNDLGGPSERFQGSWQYVGFLAWSAAVSNLAQLVFGHSPNFGGLSGVIYALVGYLWARGRADPWSGITMPNNLVIFFVVWLVLGFTGVLNGIVGGGAIANFCHLGGFAAGALYGYIAALIATGRLRR